MQHLPKVPMLIISLVQGLVLYGLYHAVDGHSWPSQSPLWSYPLWTIAVIVPLLLLLSINRGNYRSAAKQIGVFGIVLVLLAVYTGFQAQPYGEFPVSSLSITFACAVTLASFKALMYVQQRADGVELSYPVLFTNSWRNFLVAAMSTLFVLVFWLILVLWGQLFKVIDIELFWTLFREDWFLYPVLSVAFGIGVIMFRDLTHVIDNITRLIHWLFKLLLPLAVGIAVIFIAALPFVGLDALWSTGRGTSLLLWLLALTLFITNAVYQDGRESKPYPQIVHRLIYIGLCVMPVVSALSLYGLTLRLQQYGWTVERCWAFVVWLIFSLFAFGYFVGIVRHRDRWTGELAKVNTAMGIVVLVLMLLISSPVLDFRKISLASQLARVESGEIELQEFDFWDAKHNLARPGYLAMQKIKADIGDTDPDLLELVESPQRYSEAMGPMSKTELWDQVHYRPAGLEVPEGLRESISLQYGYGEDYNIFLIRVDMDRDGQDEFLLLSTHKYGAGSSQYYYLDGETWRFGWLQVSASTDEMDVPELLRSGDINVVEPRFMDVNIGGLIVRPLP